MPPLDPKEEAIVAAYIKSGGNQPEAWKETHPNSKAKPESMHQQATVFFRKLKVRSRIVEVQAQVASQSITAAALTLDAHMEKLRELRDEAEQRGQLSAAIRAEELRGQLKRLYVKQAESGEVREFDRMTDDELRVAGQQDFDRAREQAKALNSDDRTRCICAALAGACVAAALESALPNRRPNRSRWASPVIGLCPRRPL